MYSTYNISSFAEVPPLVKAFAALNGWTTAGVCEITRPGGGLTFSMLNDAPNLALVIHVLGQNPPRGVRTNLPVQGGVGQFNPNRIQPTKLYLFGGTEEGQPYIAGVIEFGFNSYRHFYIGSMVKLGDYTGGEVVSMNLGSSSWYQFGGSMNYGTYGGVRYMFSAHQFYGIDDGTWGGRRWSGGVNIVHPDNPNAWRAFYAFQNGGQPYYDYQVMGGSRDGPNDGTASKARSNYSGATILVPVNLYVPASTQAHYDARFRPIGHPAGCRIVTMENIAQGDELEVGNKHWRAFPELSKHTTTVIDAPANNWLPRESSYRAGMAYLTD